MRVGAPILTLLLSLTPFLATAAEVFEARVIEVLDGDTVEVLDISGETRRIRLAGIDAPESAQAFGVRAKRKLIELAYGRTVQVKGAKVDKYRRHVAKLLDGGHDINLTMVAAGAAWWYRKYSREQPPADRGLYEAAETAARSARVGLWAAEDPVPPWEWRHREDPADQVTECPCGGDRSCLGRRGGHYCTRPGGKKRYLPRYNAIEAAELPASRTVSIELPPLTAAEDSRIQEWEKDGPLRFAIGRELPPGQTEIDPRQPVTVQVTSAGAVGLRLGIEAARLPPAALIEVEDQVIPAAEIGAGVYWLPTVAGDTLELRLQVPPAADRPRITLAAVSHFYRMPAADVERHGCPGGWDLPARATAVVIHTDQAGNTSACTGTLLNDNDSATSVPYFLTAHHCIADRERAASIETYWFGCGDHATLVTGGADLLYASQSTDTSFLRLRKPPPAGAVFAGWSPNTPEVGAFLAGVHCPGGEAQQLAVGELQERISCDDLEYCGAQGPGDETEFLRVEWSRGETAGGSSGSGLFTSSGQLVGTLYGGRGPVDDYGRFDLPFKAALHAWLDPPRPPAEIAALR